MRLLCGKVKNAGEKQIFLALGSDMHFWRCINSIKMALQRKQLEMDDHDDSTNKLSCSAKLQKHYGIGLQFWAFKFVCHVKSHSEETVANFGKLWISVT